MIQFDPFWSFLINFDPFQVYARTDIKEPSAPTTVNVTCYDTGQLYVSWSRPDKYHKSVDYYKIFYKSASDGVFDVITIESTEKNSSPNVSLKIDLVDFFIHDNYRASHSKVNEVILLWRGYRFWFLLIFIIAFKPFGLEF